MADIEASFEERYTKMKTLAIKLKKKVDEQVMNYSFLVEILKLTISETIFTKK